MGYQLATITLGPLLLWQGRYVRRRTPRLPEASGARSGVTGTGDALRLLILGDSSAAGVGVDSQRDALLGRTVAALRHRYRVEWRLVAETGMTTQKMLTRLGSTPPGQFDVAVTALGVNDVTRRQPLSTWLADQRRLWDQLRTCCGVSLIAVSGLPPMHLFPALPQPLRWYLGMRATQFDRALAAAVARQPACQFVSFRKVHDPSAIAADGFHPGAKAYAEWGNRVASLIAPNY